MTYASVNGLQLYYETRGTGRPLVLLHGGLMTIDHMRDAGADRYIATWPEDGAHHLTWSAGCSGRRPIGMDERYVDRDARRVEQKATLLVGGLRAASSLVR